MKAELGCLCASEKPPGPYSTSTPLTLLPGTFGSSCWKTTLTLLFFPGGVCARALPNGRAATSRVIRTRFMKRLVFVGGAGSGFCRCVHLRAAEPFVVADAAEARLAQRHE